MILNDVNINICQDYTWIHVTMCHVHCPMSRLTTLLLLLEAVFNIYTSPRAGVTLSPELEVQSKDHVNVSLARPPTIQHCFTHGLAKLDIINILPTDTPQKYNFQLRGVEQS